MRATKQQILDYLRRQGQATVKELDRYLGLTSTGVRKLFGVDVRLSTSLLRGDHACTYRVRPAQPASAH